MPEVTPATPVNEQSQPLQQLYDQLAQDDKEVKDLGFDGFKSQMSDEKNLKALYGSLSEDDKEIKDYGFDRFKSDMWGKQAEPKVPEQPKQVNPGIKLEAEPTMFDQLGDFATSAWNNTKRAGAEIGKAVLNDLGSLKSDADVQFTDKQGAKIDPLQEAPAQERGMKILDEWKNSIPKDPDSFAGDAGKIVPYIGLGLASIFQPELAPATTAAFFAMGQGEGLSHAEEVEKASGEKMPEWKKQSYGLGYGTAMSVPWGGMLSKIVPAPAREWMANQFMKASPELIQGLEGTLKNFAEAVPEGTGKALSIGKDYLKGVAHSAWGMEQMDLGKVGTDKILGEKYDGVQRIIDGLGQSIQGGAIFQTILFPFAKYKANTVTVNRRNAQGTVAVGIVNGKPAEIFQSGEDYYAIRPDGTQTKSKESDMFNAVVVPTEVFNQVIKTGEVPTTIQRDVYSGRVKVMTDRLADAKGNIFFAKDENGENIYHIGRDKDGNDLVVDANGEQKVADPNTQWQSQNKGSVWQGLMDKYDENISKQPQNQSTQAGLPQAEPLDPRTNAEQQASDFFKANANQETGILKTITEKTIEGQEDNPLFVVKEWDEPGQKEGELRHMYMVKLPDGTTKQMEKTDRIIDNGDQSDHDSFVGAKLSDFDQKEEAKRMLTQEERLIFNGEHLMLTGDVTPTGDYQAINDGNQPVIVPASYIQEIMNGNAEFGQSIQQPQAPVQPNIQAEQPLQPESAQGTQGQDAQTPSNSPVVPTEGTYTYNGNPISREDAKALVDLQIVRNRKDKLEGLQYSNDPELDDMIQKAWPKPPAKFTIGGKEVSPEQAMTHIRYADDINELQELKAENIDSVPVVQQAYAEKIQEFTPTQLPENTISENQNTENVPEINRDQAMQEIVADNELIKNSQELQQSSQNTETNSQNSKPNEELTTQQTQAQGESGGIEKEDSQAQEQVQAGSEGLEKNVAKAIEEKVLQIVKGYANKWNNNYIRRIQLPYLADEFKVPLSVVQAIYDKLSGMEAPQEEAPIEQALTDVNTNPTEGQKKAGNYKKGHIKVQGMDISIENPVGSLRKGVDEDGKAWEHTMKSHYGYFKGTEGKDKDHIDTFVGNNPESKKVFVIDQVNPKTGAFDESKVMIGYESADQARVAYLENYDKDWKGLSAITEVNVDDFKKWLYDGLRQNKPFSEYRDTPEPEKELTPEERKAMHNSLIDLVEKYNKTPKNHTNKRTPMQLRILQTAMRLGKEYNVETSPRRDITITINGKKIARISTKQSAEETNIHKVLSEYPQELQDFVKRLIDTNTFEYLRIPTDLTQAAKNILDGKKTVASNMALDEIEQMFNGNVIKLRGGTNNPAMNIPVEDYFATFETPLDEQELSFADKSSDNPEEFLWQLSAYYDLSPQQQEEIDNLFIEYGHESQIDKGTEASADDKGQEHEVNGAAAEQEQEVGIPKDVREQIDRETEAVRTKLDEVNNQIRDKKKEFASRQATQTDLFGNPEPPKQGALFETPLDFSRENIQKALDDLIEQGKQLQRQLNDLVLEPENRAAQIMHEQDKVAKAEKDQAKLEIPEEKPDKSIPLLDVLEQAKNPVEKKDQPLFKGITPDEFKMLVLVKSLKSEFRNPYFKQWGIGEPQAIINLKQSLYQKRLLLANGGITDKGRELVKEINDQKILGAYDKDAIDKIIADKWGVKQPKKVTPIPESVNPEYYISRLHQILEEFNLDSEVATDVRNIIADVESYPQGARSTLMELNKAYPELNIFGNLPSQEDIAHLLKKEEPKPIEAELEKQPEQGKEPIPYDGWRGHLIKSRMYAKDLFTEQELNVLRNNDLMDWTDEKSIEKAIDTKLASKYDGKTFDVRGDTWKLELKEASNKEKFFEATHYDSDGDVVDRVSLPVSEVTTNINNGRWKLKEAEVKQPEAPKPLNEKEARLKELAERMKQLLPPTDRVEEPVAPYGGKFNTEIFTVGAEMAMLHVQLGKVSFKDFAKAMVGDFGDAIKPYLKAFYNGARDLPGMEEFELKMTEYSEVKSSDIEKLLSEKTHSKEDAQKFWDRVSEAVQADQRTYESVINSDVQNAVIHLEHKVNEALGKVIHELANEGKVDIANSGMAMKDEMLKATVRNIYQMMKLREEKEYLGNKDREREQPEEKPQGQKADLNIVPISEKAFVVTGDTRPIKDELKAMGGIWNKNHGGWMFPNTKKGAVQDYINGKTGGSQAEPEKITPNEVEKSPENEVSSVNKRSFIDAVKEKLGVEKLNIVSIRKLASEHGLEDIKDTTLQEYTELAIIEKAKEIVALELDPREKYDKIVELYNSQPTISMRSSERIEKQQYSTPLPHSFVAGRFVNFILPKSVLEPSAGNGMMVFNIDPRAVIANEIDPVRLENLREQGFKEVTDQDGTAEFNIGKVDAVITNPPFGKSPERDYMGYKIAGLDEQMVVNALQNLSDHGRASIIIGGHTKYKDNGTLAGEKAFFNYLYNFYNVADVINIDGALYAKQGTQFPVRMILINGRRKGLNRVYAPLEKNSNTQVAKTFDELYERVNKVIYENLLLQPSISDVDNDGIAPADGNVPTPDGGRGETPGTNGGTSGGNRPGNRPSRPSGTSNEPTGANRPGNGVGRDADTPSGDQGNDADGEPDFGGGISKQDSEQLLNRPDELVRDKVDVDINSEKSPYPAKSKSDPIGSVVPTNIAQTLSDVLSVFKDIDSYVQDKLGYNSKEELFNALAAEQVDSVALAIYQIENGKALIIGDMTGVGKGRQAAAIIRYATKQGKKPIFITEKAHLFSDIYRDLRDIGSASLKPFIFNSKSEKSDPTITDEDGRVIYKPMSEAAKKPIFERGEIPRDSQYAVLTYSQLNSGENRPSIKKAFFSRIASDNILILDESHNAGGSGNTGAFMSQIIPSATGVVFLSGTFAKRADNMPIYALKTDMSEANMSNQELIEAISRGGVPLQEIMSKNLVESGQMIRRERDFTGVKIDWLTIQNGEKHFKAYDGVIKLFNDLIYFQRDYINPLIEDANEEMAEEQGSANNTQGTKDFGISNTPFASKTFNIVRQLLFSLKAEDVANEAIEELKAGRKPVIAVSNTMEAFMNELGEVGDKIVNYDFSTTLLKGLDGLFRYTEKNGFGEATHHHFTTADLTKEGRDRYEEIRKDINGLSVGIAISPIDVIKTAILKAGFSIGEMTGRTNELVFNDDKTATISKRHDTDKKKLARDFNSGAIDVLILNQSASTGISLHASSKFADKRQRVMIAAQTQLDVNTEVQMRGRTDRTGQIMRSAYKYMVSPIPAEQRLTMMFKAKLKSLDANTTSNQKSKTNDIEVVDFLNKYGDALCVEYLKENDDINEKLLDPLHLRDKSDTELEGFTSEENAALKVAGRVALLSIKEQQDFYTDITEKYEALIKYLNDSNSNDLEITVLPLRAETTDRVVVVQGRGGENPFAQDSVRETVQLDVLKKPMKSEDIRREITHLTEDKNPYDYKMSLVEKLDDYTDKFIASENEKFEEAYAIKKKTFDAQTEKGIIKYEYEGEMLDEYVSARELQFESEKQEAHTRRLDKIENRRDALTRMFGMFTVGKVVMIPNSNVITSTTTYTDGILMGYKIGAKMNPSTITAVFATLDSRRRLEVPLSKVDIINAIYSETHQRFRMDTTLDNWDNKIPTKTRRTGYIVTGNILQAYGTVEGQLISFTDIDGNIRQGILLPENYQSDKQKMRVQIIKKLDEIRSGQRVLDITGDVIISSERNGFSIGVPLSKAKGGKYFLDPDLRDLVIGRDFRQMGSRMEAAILPSNLERVLQLLSDKHNTSVELNVTQARPDRGVQDEQAPYGKTPAGFYSTVEKALRNIEQNKGTAEQFKAMLLKNGAKQAELDWMGYDDQFKGSVTKQDIQDWIDKNNIQVDEVVKGDDITIKWDGLRSSDGKYELVDRGDNEFELKINGRPYGSFDGIDSAKENAQMLNDSSQSHEQNTRYAKYVEPGGENYKELLLTMPAKKFNSKQFLEAYKQFASGKISHATYNEITERMNNPKEFTTNHYEEGNILAHIRFNERTTPDGEKVLFIEELQSDWAQRGKKNGYSNNIDHDRVVYTTASRIYGIRRNYSVGQIDKTEANQLLESEANFAKQQGITDDEIKDALNKYGDFTQLPPEGVPDMPFKKTDQWVNLAMRRMMLYAVENGFDRIAWTNGVQQADRYKLSDKVDELSYDKTESGGTLIGYKDGALVVDEKNVSEDRLPEFIGKDAAEKIIAKYDQYGRASIEGEELSVGGEGMKAFYDQIIPAAVSKLGKPFGAKIEDTDISTSQDTYEQDDLDEDMFGDAHPIEGATPTETISGQMQVKSIPVTESMKEVISREGVPVFDPKPGYEKQIPLLDFLNQSREKNSVTLLRPKPKSNVRKYQPKEGPAIQYSLFTDSDNGSSTGDLQRENSGSTNPSIRRLKDGEQSAVETKYSTDKNFVFDGSNKIQSTDDVAYLFRQLENKAVENMFVCLVKDGKPTIIHMSMGNAFGTIYNANVLSDAISRFSPDKVYIIHNHPSGSLNPSQADRRVHQSAVEAYGDIIGEHIIINLTSGKYATFREQRNGSEVLERPTKTDTPTSYNVLAFDKRVFRQSTHLPFKITGSQDVASFISAQRFTNGDKLSALILSRNNTINAYLHLPSIDFTDLAQLKLLVKDLQAYTARFGGSNIILTGNNSSEISGKGSFVSAIRYLKQTLKDSEIDLVDVVNVFERNYESRAERGLMDASVPYTPKEVNDPGKSQPLMDFLRSANKASNFVPGVTELKEIGSRIWEAVKVTSAPYMEGGGGKASAQTMRANLGSMERTLNLATAQLKSASKVFRFMSNEAVLDFYHKMETGELQDTPELQLIADALRKVLDTTRDHVRDLGTGKLEVFNENYMPHFYEKKGRATAKFHGKTKNPLDGPKNFLKKRKYDTLKDAMDNGLIPLTHNPVTMTLMKVREMERYVMAHRTLNDMKHSGFVRFIRIGRPAPDGFTRIESSVGKVYVHTDNGLNYVGDWYAEENVARIFNNFLSRGLRGNLMYDAYRGIGNALTQFQLSLSAFHFGFTSFDASISAMALGIEYLYHGKLASGAKQLLKTPISPATNIIQGSRLRHAWNGEDAHALWAGKTISGIVTNILGNPNTPQMKEFARYMELAGGRAKMDDFYKESWNERIIENVRKLRILSAIGEVPLMLVEQTSRPILEFLVPRQKLGVFADMVRYEMKVNPNDNPIELRRRMQKAWDSVDNRMGQLVYDNLFWHHTFKDVLMAMVRSVGWNLGTIREVGGAFNEFGKILWDTAHGRTTKDTHKIAYAFGLIMTTMVASAIYQYLRTGKRPEEPKDYFFPKDGGKDKHGDATRVAMPTYVKDLYHYGNDFPHGASKTVIDKLNPVNGLIVQMMSNKDYYGTKIWNEDDPISQEAKDVFSYLGQQFTPFGIRNAQKNESPNTIDKVLPFFGIVPAPYDLNMTQSERLMNDILRSKLPVGGRTKEQAESSQLRTKLRNAYRDNNDIRPVREALNKKQITFEQFEDILDDSRLSVMERNAKRLMEVELAYVYKKSDAKTKKQLGPILRDKIINKLGTDLTQDERDSFNQLLNQIKTDLKQ